MKLHAHKKTNSDKTAKLRQDGNTPAICYGPELEQAIPLYIPSITLVKAVKDAGRSTIIELDVEGQQHEVLIKEIAYHPVTDQIDHVDFYAIKRGQELEVEVELVFVGHAPAEKNGHIVHHIMNEISVRCMPRNLVNHIDIDITTLTEIGDSIIIADVQKQIGSELHILDEPENAVIVVSAASEETEQTTEEQEEAIAEVLADKSEPQEEDEEA